MSSMPPIDLKMAADDNNDGCQLHETDKKKGHVSSCRAEEVKRAAIIIEEPPRLSQGC